jgi:prolyl oligopeptidase
MVTVLPSAVWSAPRLTGGPAITTVAKDPPTGARGGDPFLWLEAQRGKRALAWAREQDARTIAVLQGDSHFKQLYADALSAASNAGRIAYPSRIDGAIYNFWQDEKNPQGVWRRTTPASYATAHPKWTSVLDFDALSKREKIHWAFPGALCEWPDEKRCMLSLSNGGEDAVTMREFDLRTRSFVKGGFTLPRAKQNAVWDGGGALLVARPWSAGQVTKSGYPYVIKRLKRGKALSSADEVFRGKPTDVSAAPIELRDGSGHSVVFFERDITFFTSKYYLMTPRGAKYVAFPEKADLEAMVDGKIVLLLQQDWKVGGMTFAQGSLVAVDLAALQADPEHLEPRAIYVPGPLDSVDGVAQTKTRLIVTAYHNVRGRAYAFTPRADGSWSRRGLDLPDNSSIDIADTDLHDDVAYVTATGFLVPTTLWRVNAATGATAIAKAQPAMFDASNDVVEQHEAASKDGTKIPYFIVRPKNMAYDGANPTVLYGYGGFGISMTPSYSATLGKLWLERGGVYVLANIRGGGEFGPAWHDAALTVHRQRAYDDFYAVAQDLIARKVTSPRRLGIQGGSNGGLLMGVEFTQHPETFNAVDIQVPLLDMLRYEKIDAGSSWVGEYGSVSNPTQRAFLASISPYENLRGGVAYPEPFIWTTTKDDRVGPQHARKFAAKLAAMDVPYLFYEVTEGGHAAGANINEDAYTHALEWTYFTMKLME